jgi:hypothetical protein
VFYSQKANVTGAPLTTNEMNESKDVIARIFVHLSKRGLRRVRLSILEIHDLDEEVTAVNGEKWKDADTLFIDVMVWLEKERAIYTERRELTEAGNTYFEGVHLTARGIDLTQRNEINTLLATGATAVKNTATGSGSDGSMQKLGELIGAGLAAFTKGIAN